MLNEQQALDYVRTHSDVSPDILADGTWLLGRRDFWLSLVDGHADPDLLDLLLGDDLSPLHDEIRQSARWPVLRLGTSPSDLAVVYWHGPNDEGGYDYVVLLQGGERAISVAGRGSNDYGPGLSWPEAAGVVARGRIGTPAQRLMLLLPAIGDQDTPETALEEVMAALLEIGDSACDRDVVEEAAQQLLDHSTRWIRHDGALVCDEDEAVRRLDALPHADLLLITQALAG